MTNISDGPTKIIVSGGAGFIGSATVRHLIQNTDANVVVLDKLTYAANLDSLSEVASSQRYKLLQLDLCDIEGVSAAVRSEMPDLVLHLAAESHVDRSIYGASDFIETNIVGTLNFLEACRKYWDALPLDIKSKFKFVHISTDEVFGSIAGGGKFSETSRYAPSSAYSASKAASDHLVSAWYRTYGFPAIISNCSNNFGPYQFPEKLIPLMILNGLQMKPLPVYGDGQQIRDWLHVDDHVNALMQIAQKGKPGESYTVGGDSERTNLSVVKLICQFLDEITPNTRSRLDLIEFVADRPGHDFRYAIDATKIKSELGWAPAHKFNAALRKTVEWYIRNPDWWEPLLAKQ